MSETRFGGRVIQQKLEARRLGECPGAEGDVRRTPPGLRCPRLKNDARLSYG